MSEKKKPVFKKKKKVEKMTDTEYLQKKLKESLDTPDDRDEPLQLEFDFGFQDFFDSSDPEDYSD